MPIDNDTVARIVFAESASLRPQTTNGSTENPNNWDPSSTAKLAVARKQIAAIARAREGEGCAEPVDDIPADALSQRAWADCTVAATASAGDVPGPCDHFVIWPSADGGQTPTETPKIPDSWPYTEKGKIRSTFGPFINTYKPKSAQTYLFVYCGVP